MAYAFDRFLVWAMTGLLLMAGEIGLLAAQCVVCQQRLGDEFFWVEHPALPEKQAVCIACSKIETRCWACQLPVKDNFLKLDDGRLLCPIHTQGAVLTQHDAEALFLEVKRGMIALLRGCGTTPHQNITLRMVDAPTLRREIDSLRLPHTPTNAVGLTRTRRNGADFTHTICILTGQTRARFMATGAHEYAHAWMDENVPPERVIDPHAIEGFCELAAFKLMSEMNEAGEMKFILANAYTHGQVDLFVKVEDSQRFYQVVQWVKSGIGDRLKPEATDQALELKKPQVAAQGWLPAVPTKVPETLQLKGVSGKPGRRLALVNDQTFQEGETANVRVGSSKMQVRCVSITENSVVLTLLATGERVELSLRSE